MSTVKRSLCNLFGVFFLSSGIFLGTWACEVFTEERALSEDVELNAFIKAHKKGTAFVNIILKRYSQNTTWVKNAASTKERQKFDQVEGLFKKYAEMYRNLCHCSV